MSLDSIWLFVVIVFFIAIIPGPNALLVLSTALTQRKLFAFVNVLGVSCGFFFMPLFRPTELVCYFRTYQWSLRG
jgi:threonine/homoserine/homoserine lactone efflux protein